VIEDGKFLLNSSFIDSQITKDLLSNSVLTQQQEDLLNSKLQSKNKTKRNKLIRDMIDNNKLLTSKSIVKYNLGAYIREHMPQYWKHLMETYS
jgi:hypothetical protein